MAEPTSTWQPLDEIVDTAESFVVATFADKDARISPQAGSLDPRLRLARCTTALEAFLQNDRALTSRTVVGVRCAGDKPWKIYVPVQIAILEPVLTARRPLPRGHVLTVEDVAVEERDVGRLTRGYVSRLDDVLGKRVKQPLNAGRIITPSLLDAAILIKRGQSVTITAHTGGIQVDGAGIALADGSLNERIRVENRQSRRVIEAVVRSPQHVEVLIN